MSLRERVGRLRQVLEAGGVRPSAAQAALILGGLAALSLVFWPAAWQQAFPGIERLLPPQIYNAIHELRHLWGIPCH